MSPDLRPPRGGHARRRTPATAAPDAAPLLSLALATALACAPATALASAPDTALTSAPDTALTSAPDTAQDPLSRTAAARSATSQAAQAQPVLEQIVVTATRLDTTLAESARSIAVVDRLAIESMQAQSVAQTLLYQPNITVAGGPRAANQAVNIRGLAGNKVLQTVDGARQGFESGHRPSYFLDPELLANVEAVRGPASSLWGSGALGGVVAQRTVGADDLLRSGASLGGFLKTGYNSNNAQFTSTAALVGRAGNADWLLSGYHRDSDDIELGNGAALAGSANRSAGVLAKYAHRFGDAHRLEMIYRGASFDGAVPSNGTAPLSDTSNFLLTRDQQTHNASMDYRFTPDSDWVDARILAFANRVDMDEHRLSDGRADSTAVDTLGVNANNTTRVGAAALLYGFDVYRESFDATRGGVNRPVPPDARSDVWSAYTQAQLPLTDAWRIDLGLRYDAFRTRATNLDTGRSDSQASPSAALMYSPRDWLHVTLRHDRAFRAPSAEELYSTGTHFCMGPGFCNRFAPNPDLAPERAANSELLARIDLDGVFGADRLLLETSVFENRVDDFIEQIVSAPSFIGRPDPGDTTWINVDEARLRGGELAASYRRGGLTLRMAYGLTRGEDRSSGEDLTNVPADTLNADLSYAFGNRELLAGLRLTHAADQDRTDVPGQTALLFDGYTVADLYASWSPRAFAALRFDLNVNNVTDRFYQRAWDQLPQAGREVILSARYRF